MSELRQGTFAWAINEMVQNPGVGYTYDGGDEVFYFRLNRDGIYEFVSEFDDEIEAAVFDADDVKCETWHRFTPAVKTPTHGTIEWVKSLPDGTKVQRNPGANWKSFFVKHEDGLIFHLGSGVGDVEPFDDFAADGWTLHEPKTAPVVGSYAWAREHHTLEQRVAALEARMG